MTPHLSRLLGRLVQFLTFRQREELISMIERGMLSSMEDLPADLATIYETNKEVIDGDLLRRRS